MKEPELIAVHVCSECGNRMRRENMDGRALTSGVIECDVCGHGGQLDVQIAETDGSTEQPPKRGPRRSEVS